MAEHKWIKDHSLVNANTPGRTYIKEKHIVSFFEDVHILNSVTGVYVGTLTSRVQIKTLILIFQVTMTFQPTPAIISHFLFTIQFK